VPKIHLSVLPRTWWNAIFALYGGALHVESS
jgi:hypothetical protein